MSNERRLVDFPPSGFETITVSTTAIGITAALLTNAKAAFLTVEGADIRYRIDGTDPTAAVGHLVTDGGNLMLTDKTRAALTQLRMIRDDAVDATVSVTVY
jgi:hypothetical protein